jgi:hypothetical protein
VVAIIIDYIYPNLASPQRYEIYCFDFVVAILAVDFYSRFKKSDLPLSRFIIKHWYEIPSMMPLVLFSTIEHEALIGTAVRSIRLLRLFRIMLICCRVWGIRVMTKSESSPDVKFRCLPHII